MKHIFICTALLVAVALIGSAAAASCAGGSCGTDYTPVTTQESGCGRTPVVNSIFPFNPSDAPELPRLPHTFGGCVYLNGEPAPEGTWISITGTGVAGNTVDVGPNGCFGQGTFDAKLSATGMSVPGGMINVPEGQFLYFWVNGELPARVCIGSTCLGFTPFHTGHHTTVTLYAVEPDYGCPDCGEN